MPDKSEPEAVVFRARRDHDLGECNTRHAT